MLTRWCIVLTIYSWTIHHIYVNIYRQCNYINQLFGQCVVDGEYTIYSAFNKFRMFRLDLFVFWRNTIIVYNHCDCDWSKKKWLNLVDNLTEELSRKSSRLSQQLMTDLQSLCESSITTSNKTKYSLLLVPKFYTYFEYATSLNVITLSVAYCIMLLPISWTVLNFMFKMTY